jgi:hypothetical protein
MLEIVDKYLLQPIFKFWILSEDYLKTYHMVEFLLSKTSDIELAYTVENFLVKSLL